MAKQKWYVVIVGKEVGVFENWIEASPLVIGVPGALHQSFSSEEKANQLFAEAQEKGTVKVVAGRNVSVPAPTGPAQSVPSQFPVPRDAPAEPGRERDLPRSHRPMLTPRVSGGSGVDEPPPPSTSSSPTTNITQVVCLSSSSNGLSPLALRENELEPDTGSVPPTQSSPSSHAESSSSGRGAVVLSSDDNSAPSIAASSSLSVQHIHRDMDFISSGMAALGLLQDNQVLRAIDPRSPLTQLGSLQFP
ncbi:hypothetical protein B0H17DRAFT_1042004 [Mycena rosella]|uniref:Ribonuclease H1 N-terminal domain-containing protein n=1 Tax=Mycena rosella TaxID=1033263 RepID=A0AAD7GNE5_MYCRO|nr:hypothetical protein B0H17DRAFT_1042004 [Mycena rosella]